MRAFLFRGQLTVRPKTHPFKADAKSESSSKVLVLLIFLFEPALLVLEKLVKLANQLQESGVVSLFLDQCAQTIHAFSFVGFHRSFDGRTSGEVLEAEGVFWWPIRLRSPWEKVLRGNWVSNTVVSS